MRARILVAAIALSAIVAPLHTRLWSQPSTEGLADVGDRRPKFGVDLGGTSGPLSPFQEASSTHWIDQAAMLSYLVRARDRYPVRAVVGLYQTERLYFGFSPAAGGGAPTDRARKRILSVGALVDMTDVPLSRVRFRRIRVVGTLGAGVVPYATSALECTACGEPIGRTWHGRGAQLTGSLGLRWKRLAIDQHFFALAASSDGFSSMTGAPFTMGVRF